MKATEVSKGAERLTVAASVGAAAGLLVAALWGWYAGSTPVGLPEGAMAALSLLIGAAAGILARPGGGGAAVVTAAAAALGCWHGGTGAAPAGTIIGVPIAVFEGYLLSALRDARSEGAKIRSALMAARAGSIEQPIDGAGVWIVLPTYQEKENVRGLLLELRRRIPAAVLLVVDDDSPDGTPQIVRELAAAMPRVRLVVRHGQRGLDGALRAGFREALAAGAGAIVTMDADGSHDPGAVAGLLAALQEADIVIGSRYVAGGRAEGWPLWRRGVSLAANAFARRLLQLEARDCSSGFRAYRSVALQATLSAAPPEAGFALLEALLFAARRAGLCLMEVPIRFRDRQAGRSKLRAAEAWRGARLLLRLRRTAAAGPAAHRCGYEPQPGAAVGQEPGAPALARGRGSRAGVRASEARRAPTHRRPGFTLLELLTVISILVILMGLLLPTLARARQTAQRSTCLSNCRQLALALQMYTDDSDDVLPRWNGGWPAGTWDTAVSRYVRNSVVFHCPANPRTVSAAVVRSYALPRNISGLALAAVPDAAATVALYEKGGAALGARADSTGEFFQQTYGVDDFRLWHGNGKLFAFLDGHARFWPVGRGPWAYDFRPPLGTNNYGPGYCGGQINTTADDDGGPGKNLPP